MAIKRYISSIHQGAGLYKSFLQPSLLCAKKYDRISGYFKSSILSLISEDILNIEKIRLICNADIDQNDLYVSKIQDRDILKSWLKDMGGANNNKSLLDEKAKYELLFDLLKSKKLEVKVIPTQHSFIHAKVGMMENFNGEFNVFLGSSNDTHAAFTTNYEALWADNSEEAVYWFIEEFERLWEGQYAINLPDLVIRDIQKKAKSSYKNISDFSSGVANDVNLLTAAIAEYKFNLYGMEAKPWQKKFVEIFLSHREAWGKARILLADEVGVGKTYSLFLCALFCAIKEKKPVLLLVPASLMIQWQDDIYDNFGIDLARWANKRWVMKDENASKKHSKINECPTLIGLVSTGALRRSGEKVEDLLKVDYSCVIVDEAHTAGEKTKLNGVLKKIAHKTGHFILATATPIQKSVDDLWALLKIINADANMILGNKNACWNNRKDCEQYLGVVGVGDKDVRGKTAVLHSSEAAWSLISNPWPPLLDKDSGFLKDLYEGLKNNDILKSHRDLTTTPNWHDVKDLNLEHNNQSVPLINFVHKNLVGKNSNYFTSDNPLKRHIVKRKRRDLEDQGLLEKIEVCVHPRYDLNDIRYNEIFRLGCSPEYKSIKTHDLFQKAYDCARNFCEEISRREVGLRGTGFIQTILERRISSSAIAGLITADKILNKNLDSDLYEGMDYTGGPDNFKDQKIEKKIKLFENLSEKETNILKTMIRSLEDLKEKEKNDPKLEAILYLLSQHKIERTEKTWGDIGSIIFSQYYDTAEQAAVFISSNNFFRDTEIGLYSSSKKTAIFTNGTKRSVSRDELKKMISRKEIRIIVATDAACEGLNLQTIGSLINIDLPWNPARLEQRLGRIRRIGQTQSKVQVCNLIYGGTCDEKVYRVLSERFKENAGFFGSIPESIEEKWVDLYRQDLEDLKNEIKNNSDSLNDKQDFGFHTNFSASEFDNDAWETFDAIRKEDVKSILLTAWNKC